MAAIQKNSRVDICLFRTWQTDKKTEHRLAKKESLQQTFLFFYYCKYFFKYCPVRRFHCCYFSGVPC